MIGIDALVTLGSMVLPPAVDLIKKIFVKKEEDSPEATMSALATTRPEVLPQYVGALSNYQESLVKWFNRDVIGTASQWVVDFRAVIRPVVISLAVIHVIAVSVAYGTGGISAIPEGWRYFYESIIGSWFGERLVLDKK
ncbi:MAG: hypothetical protein M1510_04020 [Nitrospirae bacterium]|nr:hypothetical protein [Nitrospirota bacterium]